MFRFSHVRQGFALRTRSFHDANTAKWREYPAGDPKQSRRVYGNPWRGRYPCLAIARATRPYDPVGKPFRPAEREMSCVRRKSLLAGLRGGSIPQIDAAQAFEAHRPGVRVPARGAVGCRWSVALWRCRRNGCLLRRQPSRHFGLANKFVQFFSLFVAQCLRLLSRHPIARRRLPPVRAIEITETET